MNITRERLGGADTFLSKQLGKGEHCVYWFGQRNYSKVQHGMVFLICQSKKIPLEPLGLYTTNKNVTALVSKFDVNRESFAGLSSSHLPVVLLCLSRIQVCIHMEICHRSIFVDEKCIREILFPETSENGNSLRAS